METITDLALVIVGLVVIAGGALYYYRRWQTAEPDERQTLLAEAVERLAQEAEYLFPQRGRGYERLRWVLTELRKSLPDVTASEALPVIDTTVTKINATKAHRNGAHDR